MNMIPKPMSDSNVPPSGFGVPDSAPFAPNEGMETGKIFESQVLCLKSFTTGYNPADFFGPSGSAGFEEGIGDGFPFGDMAFDSDSLVNFGGMGPYNGDLGKSLLQAFSD